MQNLNVGSRYYVKHPAGIWEGEVTYTGYVGDMFKIKDVKVVKGNDSSISYFKDPAHDRLNGSSEWSWKELNINLENE